MRTSVVPPVLAAGLACAYLLAAALAPGVLLVVVPAAVTACAASVLLRRPRRSLAAVLVCLLAWLLLSVAGASVLSDSPRGGMAWLVLVVFLVPLPVVPWVYWRTFEAPEPGAEGPGTGAEQ